MTPSEPTQDWVLIHTNLTTYIAALDSKSWSSIASLFTTDCTMIIPQPVGTITTNTALADTFSTMLPPSIPTQHLLSAPQIDIASDRQSAKTTANIIASHWAMEGKYKGEYLRTYGVWTWEFVKSSEGKWLVKKAELVHMGMFEGNPSIFTPEVQK